MHAAVLSLILFAVPTGRDACEGDTCTESCHCEGQTCHCQSNASHLSGRWFTNPRKKFRYTYYRTPYNLYNMFDYPWRTPPYQPTHYPQYDRVAPTRPDYTGPPRMLSFPPQEEGATLNWSAPGEIDGASFNAADREKTQLRFVGD